MTTTLVLVHGCGTSHHLWDELLPELSVPTLAVTLPGRPPTQGTPPGSAGEAAAWLRDHVAARCDRAIIVGHSYGGAIAIEYALLSPPELAGLVLVATGARLRVLPAILEMTAEAARKGEPADVASFAYIKDTDPALVARMRALDREVPLTTTAADWHACNRFDRLRDVAAIDTRTVVVNGDADTLTPLRYAQHLAAMIPNARLHVVPGAGHMLPVEQAPTLARILESIYSDSGAPPDAAT